MALGSAVQNHAMAWSRSFHTHLVDTQNIMISKRPPCQQSTSVKSANPLQVILFLNDSNAEAYSWLMPDILYGEADNGDGDGDGSAALVDQGHKIDSDGDGDKW